MENSCQKEYVVSIKCMHVPSNAKKFLRLYLNQCTKNIYLRLILLPAGYLSCHRDLSFTCLLCFFLLITLHFPMYHLGNQISASLHSPQEVKHI